MFNNSTPFSMPVVPAGTSGGGLGGFGDSWIGLIIILALLFGWGNGGFNSFGGGNGGQEVQRGFDQQAVISKLDGITNGLSDGVYALNSGITAGFNGVQQTLCQGFSGVNTGMLQGFNGLQAQLAQCCCDNRAAIADVKYQMATDTCGIQNTIQNTTRDILENNNANTRAILDFLTTDKIATLQAENQSLKLAASQANQNAVLQAAMDANTAEIIRRTGNDCPIPAYVVQPPAQVTFPVNSCGTFAGYGGCGCA